MKKKIYTPLFFKKGLPEWKRKKDPFLAQIFYRPLSFVGSSLFASLNCSANTVSYLTIIISLIASGLFFFSSHTMHIWGAIMVNVWLLFDCIDGNIARCIKKQPFGVFADATACYTLLAFLYQAMAYAVYVDGGFVIGKGYVWIIVIGGLTSAADMLMRLEFHKFREGEIELNKVLGRADTWLDDYKPHNPTLKEKLWAAVNIGGYLPVLILLATIFRFLDLVVFLCFFIDILSLCFFMAKMISKAITLSKEHDDIYNKEWENT